MATYLRLRCLTTGHQFDATQRAAAAYLAAGAAEIVTRHPPYTASRPRPAKPLRSLAGLRTTPRRRPSGRPTTSRE